MLPIRLRQRIDSTDTGSAIPSTTGSGSLYTYILVGAVIVLVGTNLLTLGDAGFHAKAYELVDGAARALGFEKVLADSPTRANRRVVEEESHRAAEAAVRQQRAATTALIANSLVLVDATNALVKEHRGLKRAHLALADTTKVISRRVAARTAASATRSVTTLTGKALPFAGTASILALTAYDIADACQTLKDANELALAAGVEPDGEEGRICKMQVPSMERVKAWAGGFWK